ncbi:MAG: CoA-transferase [Mycobacterium sp.]|nr:CoA-transferase [Mycobacterium sp.]
MRASSADEDGNISFEHEAANLDAQSLALAARNSGGKVIVQVKERLPHGALKAREVRIPAAWVDAIVVDPNQSTSYDIPFHPGLQQVRLAGEARYQSESEDRTLPRKPLPTRHSVSARPWPAARRWSCSTPPRPVRWSITAWACPTRWPS